MGADGLVVEVFDGRRDVLKDVRRHGANTAAQTWTAPPASPTMRSSTPAPPTTVRGGGGIISIPT